MAGPSMENIGLGLFRMPPFNSVIGPMARWYRTTLFKPQRGREDGQRIVIEQINKGWLRKRGLPDNGDLYKTQYGGTDQIISVFETHTQKHKFLKHVEILLASSRAIDINAPDAVAQYDSFIDLQNFVDYSAGSELINNWDGFFNNHWLYRDKVLGKWRLFPWDMDKTFGLLNTIDAPPQFYDMALDYPIYGTGLPHQYGSRPPGPITQHLMRVPGVWAMYMNALKCATDFSFGPGILQKIDIIEEALIYDERQLLASACHDSAGLSAGELRDCRRSRWTQVTVRHPGLKLNIPP